MDLPERFIPQLPHQCLAMTGQGFSLELVELDRGTNALYELMVLVHNMK